MGQCVAQDLANSDLVSELVLADVKLKGAEAVKKKAKADKVRVRRVDASDPKAVAELAKEVDILVNGTIPEFNLSIMRGCLDGGANYIDMANGDSEYGHPMFEDQQQLDKQFAEADLFALCAMGIDPGASDLFAKRAADRMDSVDYVKVRDADTGKVEGYEFATYFSPDAMLEECIKDPLYYENGKWARSPALAVSEEYSFPEPIGTQKVYRTDHEECELVPKFLGKKVKNVDFMITLDETFVQYVRMLKKIGLVSFKPLEVRGTKVVPFDVVVASMPRPDDLGGRIKGIAMVLTEVGGRIDGKEAVVRTWTYLSHERAHELSGIHATAYQTAMPVAVAVEMLARGELAFTGVRSPEAVDAAKFCEYLPAKSIPVYEETIYPGKSAPASSEANSCDPAIADEPKADMATGNGC